ncbi:MAG: hypothetical protein IJ422_00255 [Oscillospiraceae bacterium]|nr:hypothetical protein [Oscillospiraceae bacterium]
MKKIIAFVLCLILLLSLAACGGNEDAGQGSDGTSAQTGEAEDTPGGGETTLSADNNEDTQVVETTGTAVEEAFPIPEGITVTDTSDDTDKQMIDFNGEVAFGIVQDYVTLLESMGFTFNADECWDGLYRVDGSKEGIFVLLEFNHGMRDDLFWERINQGEVITGPFRGSITIDK